MSLPIAPGHCSRRCFIQHLQGPSHDTFGVSPFQGQAGQEAKFSPVLLWGLLLGMGCLPRCSTVSLLAAFHPSLPPGLLIHSFTNWLLVLLPLP